MSTTINTQCCSVIGGSRSIAGLTCVVPIVFGVGISNGQHGDEVIQFLCMSNYSNNK